MHVTTKEIDDKGVHILTSVLEGDGALALASEKAELKASIVSVQRTESGGVKVQVALSINEPAPVEAPAPSTPEDEAVSYLAGKGFDAAAALLQVSKFGASRILSQRDAEKLEADKKLDEELKALLTPKAEEAKAETGTVN